LLHTAQPQHIIAMTMASIACSKKINA